MFIAIINMIQEFLFCPMHGLFAPQNFAMMAPVITPITTAAAVLWRKVRSWKK